MAHRCVACFRLGATRNGLEHPQPLKDIGGKGLFTKELDTALLGGEVDLCVHSMKDVPTWLVPGSVLPANLPREDTRDVLIAADPRIACLADLPDGAVVGTASLRRQAQLLARNPRWTVVNFRGNVQSRLRKLSEGAVDATLLAYAGYATLLCWGVLIFCIFPLLHPLLALCRARQGRLRRMNMTGALTAVISMDEMLPAVSQGAIGLQCREGDTTILRYLAALNHADTKACVDCERAFLASLDGNCRTPIAGQAVITGGGTAGRGNGRVLSFRGLIAAEDGREVARCEGAAPFTGLDPREAVALGDACGLDLRARAPHLVDALRA